MRNFSMGRHVLALAAATALAGCHSEPTATVTQPPPRDPACASETPWMLALTAPGQVRPGRVAVDAHCAVVLTGAAQGSLASGGHTVLTAGDGAQFAAKVDAGGAVAWAVALGTADVAGTSSEGGDLQVAALGSGDVVVAGALQGDLDAPGGAIHGGKGAPFLARLDGSTGAVVWAKLLPGAGTAVGGVAVDATGNVVVAGTFSGKLDLGAAAIVAKGGTDAFVARFDEDGGPLSAVAFGGAQDDTARAVVVDPKGAVLVAGAKGSQGGTQSWLLKLDGTNTVTWEQTLGETAPGVTATSVASDAEGDALVLADVGAAGESLTCVSAGGIPMWSLDDPTTRSVVRSDTKSSVYLAGGFAVAKPPDFGGGALGVAASQMGLTVPYVAKLDEERAHLYSEGFSAGENVVGADLATDAAGGLWVLMGYGDAFDTDVGPVPSPGAGASGLLLARFAPGTLMGEPKMKAQTNPGG